jgi:hypothetical protein
MIDGAVTNASRASWRSTRETAMTIGFDFEALLAKTGRVSELLEAVQADPAISGDPTLSEQLEQARLLLVEVNATLDEAIDGPAGD